MEFEGSYLPEDLILEILSRVNLTPKSVTTFASIPKQWLFLTREPAFVDIYQQQASKWPPRLLVLSRASPELGPVHDAHAESSWPRPLLLDEDSRTLEPFVRDVTAPCRWITSPCNGFVCLHKTHGVQVWNPITGESLFIGSGDSHASMERFFLGCHRVTERYKLVRVYTLRNEGALHIDVLDFGDSSSWRMISAHDLGYVVVRSASVCGQNGTMYICVFSSVFTYKLVVLAIDLGEEKVVQLSRPPSCLFCKQPHVDVLEMDGRLCLGHCCESTREDMGMSYISVYMLMSEDDGGVWEKKYESAGFRPVEGWWDCASVVTIWNEKVLLRHKRGLCWYDMTKRLLDVGSFVGIDTATEMACGVIHPYVESLAPIQRLYA